jgi:hypothetical protein
MLDFYDNLFDMAGGQEILAENPIVCATFNRMAYISVNSKRYLPKKLMVFPYLHERKIYLNKQKPGNSYFYTTIEEVDEKHLFNSQHEYVKNWAGKVKQFTRYIISMDLDRSIYYVMSDKGILLNKINFSDQVKKYGKPIQISPNGKNFIF